MGLPPSSCSRPGHTTTRVQASRISSRFTSCSTVLRSALCPCTIVAGDFNSNSYWDREYKPKPHTAAVSRFRKLGLESAYHQFFGHSHGAEQNPTLWFRKNNQNPHHVDYVFLSRPLLSKRKSVTVGHCDAWVASSDHAPVLVEIDLKVVEQPGARPAISASQY